MKSIFERTAEIIATKGAYISGGDVSHAVDAGGKACEDPSSEAAEKWTLRGALYKACVEAGRVSDFKKATDMLLHQAANTAKGMSDHAVVLELLHDMNQHYGAWAKRAA